MLRCTEEVTCFVVFFAVVQIIIFIVYSAWQFLKSVPGVVLPFNVQIFISTYIYICVCACVAYIDGFGSGILLLYSVVIVVLFVRWHTTQLACRPHPAIRTLQSSPTRCKGRSLPISPTHRCERFFSVGKVCCPCAKSLR